MSWSLSRKATEMLLRQIVLSNSSFALKHLSSINGLQNPTLPTIHCDPDADLVSFYCNQLAKKTNPQTYSPARKRISVLFGLLEPFLLKCVLYNTQYKGYTIITRRPMQSCPNNILHIPICTYFPDLFSVFTLVNVRCSMLLKT